MYVVLDDDDLKILAISEFAIYDDLQACLVGAKLNAKYARNATHVYKLVETHVFTPPNIPETKG